ncbi:hypothetical protein [Reichenbachiella sp. MALMAid0571]|uniref:hypothetical protein n=1 Tax=Reichenbachiella sp. MALMAid0571 TaxID=3143939 RepID=UPI0032DF5652
MKTTSNFYTVMIIIVKLLPIIILLLVATTYSNAQGIKATTYIEKTKMSPKLGHSIGVVFPSYLGDMELGGFYQKSMISNSGEYASNRLMEEKFYGFYIGISFIQTERINVNFNLRTGTVNDKFLAITPSVFSDLMISKALGIGVGLGMRNLQPTYSGRIILKMSGLNGGYSKHNYSQRRTYKYR